MNMRPTDCSEMSVGNYQYTLRKIPEERESHLHRPESRNFARLFCLESAMDRLLSCWKISRKRNFLS